MNPRDQATTVVRNLRRAGFVIVDMEVAARPWSAAYFRPDAVLLHHTASTSVTSVENERSDAHYIRYSVPWGAPGAQFYVGRTGRIYLLCKGGANHAGSGNELVKHGVPINQGNYKMWGIEVQSAGLKEDWTKDQWLAVHALTGELCKAMGVEADRVWRHKDYDNDSGKIDTQYELDEHRRAVREYLHGQEDEMQQEDWDKLRRIVREEVHQQVKPLAEETVKELLDSDVFPKREDIDFTVRQAFREAREEEVQP